jgi:hypothetical protein
MEESLAGLKAAFDAWRSRKQHPREAVPAALLERARAAARRHGAAAVARVAKVERARLALGTSEAATAGAPGYSRVEMPAPTSRPFAEIEMPTGVKVRLFTDSGEALGLLSRLLGGAR